MATYNPVTPEIIEELKKISGDRVVVGADVNPDYSRDEMPIYGTKMPDVSIDVLSTEEVSAIMKVCYDNNIPVTCRGAGTGLVGACTPIAGGVVLCTMRMKQILEYDTDNFVVRVQPGVLLNDLAEDALKQGLLYPPDPGEKFATLGGNVSTNAGGMRAVKYGATRDYVRAMTVVLPTGEIVKTTWKCYIPAAVTGVCSAACIIGASSISARRNAALVTAYTISETALKEYKDKAVEVVGPKKEQAIRDAVAKEQLEQAGVPERKFIPTGRGETPCFDPLTNTCFKSDIETLRRAENTLNKRMRDEVKVTVNEFMQEIGLEPCDSSIGETMGWDIDKGYIELDFSSQLVDGVPYLVLGHRVPPVYLGW